MKKSDKTKARPPGNLPVMGVIAEFAPKLQAILDARKELHDEIDSQCRLGQLSEGVILALKLNHAREATMKGHLKVALQNALDAHLRSILAQTKEQPPGPRPRFFNRVRDDISKT